MSRDTTFPEFRRDRAVDQASAEFVLDEDSFRAFYERTARGLWAYLARITGDRQLADDLLQETFYRFLRAAAAYDSETHRRNSLYRIASNLARDARRRSLTRIPFGVTGSDVEHLASTQDAAAPEKAADFSRAMAHLKPRDRALLWLAYAEGASHSEIAHILGLRPASLKTMLFRARRTLAALLGRVPEGGKL